METRVCKTCTVEYPLSKFINGYARDGVTRVYIATCQPCRYKRRLEQNPNFLREKDLKKKYKMSLDAYFEMLKSQGGVCAICGVKPSTKYLAVDHDHNCCDSEKTCGNCIRGLLCNKCNHGIGQFNDNTEKLQKAIEYLKKYS